MVAKWWSCAENSCSHSDTRDCKYWNLELKTNCWKKSVGWAASAVGGGFLTQVKSLYQRWCWASTWKADNFFFSPPLSITHLTLLTPHSSPHCKCCLTCWVLAAICLLLLIPQIPDLMLYIQLQATTEQLILFRQNMGDYYELNAKHNYKYGAAVYLE